MRTIDIFKNFLNMEKDKKKSVGVKKNLLHFKNVIMGIKL